MRKSGSNGQVTKQAIRDAAIELISQHGFEAVNLRELAARCGIQAGSLYNHFGSKQELLRDLLHDVMQDLLADFNQQVAVLPNPIEQMRAFIKLHIEFHTRRRLEVLLGNTELRSLTEENYQLVTGLRDRYEHGLRKIIQDGVRKGNFTIPDAKVASFAIIAMLTGVGYWYRPNGSLNQQRLVEVHEQLVFQTLGANLTSAAANTSSSPATKRSPKKTESATTTRRAAA